MTSVIKSQDVHCISRYFTIYRKIEIPSIVKRKNIMQWSEVENNFLMLHTV